MQQTFDEDDWDTYIDNVPTVLPVQNSVPIEEDVDENDGEDIEPVRHLAQPNHTTAVKVQHVGYRNMNLDDVSTNAVAILKNVRIVADRHVRLPEEYHRMRIYGNLNKLWHINNLEKYLKSAIDFYDKDSKATTTKTNQKQIDTLVKAIDRVNGIISAIAQQLRTQPDNEEIHIRLRETTETKKTLEREQHAIMSVSVEEKKNDVKTLKELSQTLLRILSKDDSRAKALHSLLVQKVNPSGYAARLAETEERVMLAEEQRKQAYETRREQSRIDRIVEGYSHVDKENYMIAREMYSQRRNIPRELQKYVMVIEHSPYLSFAGELAKSCSAAKVVLTVVGSDHQYKKQFPTVGVTVAPNAWTQKLGTKVEEKSTVQGAWVARIDTEKLVNLPDPPKVVVERKVCSQTMYLDEDEDEWLNANPYTNHDYSDEEW